MKRGFVLLLCLWAAMPAAAQVTTPAPDKKRPTPFVLPTGVQPIRLTLHPAPAPVPALKYRLLPELRDLKPGNAVLLYYRAFSPEWQVTYRRPEVSKPMDEWSEDTRKVPSDKLRWLLHFAALKEMDLGARRAHVDWEMIERLRQEGIAMLLPDIQSFRSFAVMLGARARFEILDGNFDKAIYTLQTGYKLGHDVGDAVTLIQALVGMAITNQMFVQTEELIQTPGSPNLYWALTDLPRPFISLQKPYQGERIFIDNLFPGIREVLASKNATPLPEEGSRAMVDKLVRNARDLGIGGSNEWEARLGLAALAARTYPEAKRVLLSLGRSKEQVESMSVLQAFLLLEVYNYDRFYDEFMKWSTLPYREGRKGLVGAEASLREAKANATPGTLIATLLLPAVQKVQMASVRTERRIAALRIVEALRLYAAAHDGKLPATLADIKEVPIPLDPMTGNAFEYRVEADRVTLYGPAPAGETPYINNVLMYELTPKRR